MRPKSSKEKLLLFVLLGVVFFMVNFYGYQWLSARQTTLHKTLLRLRDDKEDALDALKESDQWAQRRTWISQRQPALGDEGDAKANTLESIKKGADANKLDVLEQSLNDSQSTSAARA
ncbi:MAG: hypothetical protein WDO13_12630 [Verrucomicrobiota bacterium]